MLIECVPNFSEGRDQAVIDAIAAAIASTDGAELLDVDPGRATNRTVMTFVGPPEAVEEAAYRAIATAADLIDMSRHRGEHPRMGATDVCPFVPVEGATMEDCVALARRVGRRVGDELGIPVYLYEAAATTPERQSLADVRRGEYEGLADRTDPPDFGPATFQARSGATAIGAREFLIAYNVNLNTRDRRLANAVAGMVRESGRPQRDADGSIVRDADGVALRVPGRFTDVKGVGWYIDEYGLAQVSLNLTNFRVASLHDVFDACVEEAAGIGLRVTGSEIVGLVPREALLAAGDHYLAKQGRTTGVPEGERIHTAVLSLGLGDLEPFDPAAKVIEYRYRGAPSGLAALSLGAFADELSSDSPAPGGGSVAALCGALAAALASMVAALTWPKKGFEEHRPEMQELGRAAQDLKDWFLAAVDRDAAAFDAVLAAIRLPKATETELRARAAAMEAANRGAALVPLEVLERCGQVLDLALDAAERGNPNSVSDAGVAGAAALAAAEGASLNVRINLPSIADEAARTELEQRRAAALDTARARTRQVATAVDTALDA